MLADYFDDDCANNHDDKGNYMQGREAIERHRGNCAEFSKLELDMAILGQLGALDHRGPTSGGVHRRDVVRAHTHCEFYFEGEKICKNAFLFLYGIVYQSMVLYRQRN